MLPLRQQWFDNRLFGDGSIKRECRANREQFPLLYVPALPFGKSLRQGQKVLKLRHWYCCCREGFKTGTSQKTCLHRILQTCGLRVAVKNILPCLSSACCKI